MVPGSANINNHFLNLTFFFIIKIRNTLYFSGLVSCACYKEEILNNNTQHGHIQCLKNVKNIRGLSVNCVLFFDTSIFDSVWNPL